MNKYVATIGLCIILTNATNAQDKSTTKVNDRVAWLNYLDKVSRPVMSSLAEGRLKEKLPKVMSKRIDNAESRSAVAYLEAFGRTLMGIAPWMNLEGGSKEEVALRNKYREWSLKAVANAVDTALKDYMVWDKGGQPLVDASFVALGFIRCPWLWEHLNGKTKSQVVAAFKKTRSIVPTYSNWILFTGMIEAFFCKYGLEYDKVRIEYGVREFSSHWYVGDGMFSDGMDFAMDYYNSYVIQPYLATIVEIANNKTKSYTAFATKLDRINKRYAEIQERMISADGSYPALGRSIVYRGAAFQHLADMALRKQLPASLKPAQVRGALTAVIRKTLDPAGTFDKDGWLTIGLGGNQPDLADVYNTTGSLYLCTAIFLPLGLPETDEFWSSPALPWSSVKIWSGQDTPGDHALHIN
ncbi:DUF2264 domain-containing protein [Segetibacter aerophilus]|uniref:DUF2264 domain-containing protein n=1 Tax=Segetibacter aerophilus TaxID=670293 RepID=A0A512BH55_9BACT|nr:DUF2264 domain-containing protein [Segetibacter aerophilus]GEO11147.1 hypothetical protein SAE01_36430 [Segetibacter aerophilus]